MHSLVIDTCQEEEEWSDGGVEWWRGGVMEGWSGGVLVQYKQCRYN